MSIICDQTGKKATGYVAIQFGSTWHVVSESGRIRAYGFASQAAANTWITANEIAFKTRAVPGA